MTSPLDRALGGALKSAEGSNVNLQASCKHYMNGGKYL